MNMIILDPTPTAVSNLIHTPELLELILSHLDIPTLSTTALNICHQWRLLISTSPLLQQKLFRRPVPQSIYAQIRENLEAEKKSREDGEVGRIHTIQLASIHGLHRHGRRAAHDVILARDATLNPILTHLFPASAPPISKFTSRHGYLQARINLENDVTDLDYSRPVWVRCPEIWRKMYVFQPPTEAVTVARCKGWWGWEFADIREEKGDGHGEAVTVGTLLDWLQDNEGKLRKGFIIMSCPPTERDSEQDEVDHITRKVHA